MKPFLKWAGNKYQIIERIKSVLPPGNRLIEPFAGSAAVFLNTDYPKYLISDNNKELIDLYKILQQEGDKFINYCRHYFDTEYNSPEAFYELREQFNSEKNTRVKSALFLYLNKHCFNGLCRFNAKGKFNTPFGKYSKPYFPEKELKYFYQKSQHAIFKCEDFVAIMNSAERGDVIYCDPPFVPLSSTANFTSYSSGGFSTAQHLALAKLAELVAQRDVSVVISNHQTEFVLQAYSAAQIITFDVQRYISASSASRSKVSEILAVFS